MCGDCCRGLHDGEVYLYHEDIHRLADHLKMKGKKGLKTFAKKYLKVINDNFFWKSEGAKKGKTYRFKTLGFAFAGRDEHCHFLINNECSVHEARPFQCRSFPFWQMMVSNSKNLQDYTKKCKGLQELKGKYYSKEEILKWARDEYEIEKKYFLEMKDKDFDIIKVYPFLSKDNFQENK
jgi:Fe-S-cluster containining protein